MEQIIPRHGVPTKLLSDRGAAFLSNLMKEVCQLMNIHKVNKTAYHPQTDDSRPKCDYKVELVTALSTAWEAACKMFNEPSRKRTVF